MNNSTLAGAIFRAGDELLALLMSCRADPAYKGKIFNTSYPVCLINTPSISNTIYSPASRFQSSDGHQGNQIGKHLIYLRFCRFGIARITDITLIVASARGELNTALSKTPGAR